MDSISTVITETITTTEPTSQPTLVAPSNNIATLFIYRTLELLLGRVPYGIYRLLTLTVTATITLDFWGILYVSLIGGLIIILFMRSKVVDPYTRLEHTTQVPRNTFDLKPDSTLDDSTSNGYPDELMNAFLSSIKVFGYLDKPVFHELAKNLQTKKLSQGELLFDVDSQDRDFYVVVEGKIQVYINGEKGSEEDDGNHLLNEVRKGGTVTSLFAILSILSEDLELPKPLVSNDTETSDSIASTPLHSPARTNDEEVDDFEDGGVTPGPEQGSKNKPWDNDLLQSSQETDTMTADSFKSDKTERKKVVRNVHPNLIAKAASNTTLAVIPASAFRNLSEKYPKAAAQMAQVILTRFQRVTFLTLHRYLGLSSELLSIERKVNEIAGTGLPHDMFDSGVIERVAWKLSHTGSSSSVLPTTPVSSKEKKPTPIRTDDSQSGLDLGFSDIERKQRQYLRELGAHSFTTGDSDEKLKDSIFHCIAQLIGLTPSKEVAPKQSTPTSSVRGLGPVGNSVERFYYSTRRSSIASMSTASRKSGNFNWDEVSISSRTSSLEESDSDIPDVEIKFFKQGDVLLKEGERSPGLFFVLDGTIEASTTPSKDLINIQRKWTESEPKVRKRALFVIHPGGLAGYLAALTDVLVGLMPKAVLDRYVEKYPNVSLCLAKRLVNQLSPLVFHIDVALEWGQVNAGQTLCHQGDKSQSIFIVLNGRLRSIKEQTKDGSNSLQIQGEHGQSESVGELEVLIDAPRPATIHAIRDTEVAIMPKTLFNALAIRHPEILMTISRMIAIRSIQNDRSFESTATSNENLKTVALLPVNSEIPIIEFAEKLTEAFSTLGAVAGLIHTRTVMSHLGKHAFTKLGRLKLLSWLAEQEESHRIVLYVADGGVNAPWTQRCIRQADCVLVVGLGDGDPLIGEYEQLLLSMKTTARKELVLLHSDRSCTPGTTSAWLKLRLWIHAHYHIQMNTPATVKAHTLKQPTKQMTIGNLGAHFRAFYGDPPSRSNSFQSPNIYSGIRSDFARLARRLLSKSVGLVLGGGGAKGIAHVGIIRAFEEVGIPIDMVGGTSMGAFVGGVYARETDHVSVYGRCKLVSVRINSVWRMFLDLTYPVLSLTTGHAFNRGIFQAFFDTLIEDCWIPYFAVTANITYSRTEAHTQGYMWRYVRASMSLSGYFPPICDNGSMLMDGGYFNNVPADIMKEMGANTIIAVDVGYIDDTSPITYGDKLSGWYLLLRRLFPFIGKHYGPIPTLSDIQARLAYASSVPVRAAISKMENCFYLTPPIQHIATMGFDKFAEVEKIGYDYARQIITEWSEKGILQEVFGVKIEKLSPFTRRASI